MPRNGYLKVPNALYDDERLTIQHIGLLVFLASHQPGFPVKAGFIQKRFRVTEERWKRLKEDLETWGYLRAEFAYQNRKRIGFRFWVSLKPGNMDLVGATKTQKPMPRKPGVSKKTTLREQRPASGVDLIDDDDPLLHRFRTDPSGGES